MSEQQGWAPQHIKVIWQDNRSFDQNLEAVCDKINATPGAGREVWKAKLQASLEVNTDLEKQLVAERQATSNAFIKGYDQGYADATAALAK